MRALALALVLLPLSAHAFDFHLGKQPFRLEVTESTFAAYHGDLGYLQTEHDAAGRPVIGGRFADLLNKLNLALSWKKLRLFARFDTAVYFDRPDGSCGPAATTIAPLRSRFCQKYLYLEKIGIEYVDRSFEVTLGDFYVSFGRGLVLSLRKLDELGIDTTLQGIKVVFHEGDVVATLVTGLPAVVWGGANIQNVDQATGRFADDPHDFLAGGRVEYRLLDKVILGFHEVGGTQATNAVDVPHQRQDNFLMYGGSIDAPRLTRWLQLYLEAAGQRVTVSDAAESGYAIYGAATFYTKRASILLEGKHYSHYQRWRSSIDKTLAEFAPVVYNQPPTAERVQTELLSPIYDVSGGRARVDWRATDWLLLYASYGFFQDRGTPDGVQYFHDPYAGAELRWNQGRSHLFPSGGYRTERCADDAMDCLSHSPGGEFQHIGHLEWDATQVLGHGLSLEAQGFVLFRQGENVTTGTPGNMTYPSWTEGDAYLALKWTPHLIGTVGYEWSTRPKVQANDHYFNGSLQWNITTASSLRLFVGGTRGGLKCISGICRDFPAFTGARLEVVVRL